MSVRFRASRPRTSTSRGTRTDGGRQDCDTRAVQSLLRSPLVGRDDELGDLEAALARARLGHGSLKLVLGEAGIGKSRLVSELALAAQGAGVAVLSGRAPETDRPAPFRPFAEALSARFRGCGPPELPELRPLRGALGRLIPEWRDERLPMVEESLVIVAEAVLRLLRGLAGEDGCLLVLEDIHWADPETLSVVEYLADNLGSEPVLCVVTVRSDEATPARALARSLTARRAATAMDLDRLAGAEIDELARGCLDAAVLPQALTEPLRTWTEGVPFLIEELLAAWVSGGVVEWESSGECLVGTSLRPVVPPTFAATVRRRLDSLGEHGRPVTRAAAVLGRRFEWQLLPPMTGLSPTAVLDLLGRCVTARLVAEEPSGDQAAFRFHHALTRDAILADLLSPERAEWSGRALRAVEAAHPALEGPWCELAADLAKTAGNHDSAVALLLVSGRRALAQGALASAEAALERASALPARPEVAIEVDEALAEVLSLAGKVERAIEVGTRLEVACRAGATSVARQAEVNLRLARALLASSQWARADDQLTAARRLASRTEEPRVAARIDALAAHVALGRDRLDEATALAGAALEVAEEVGLPEVACEALEVIGRRARIRDLGEAQATFDRARQIAEEHGLTLWKIRAVQELSSIDVFATVSLARLVSARAMAYDAGALATAATLDLHIAAVMSFHFDAAEGRAVAGRCAETARRLKLGLLLPMALVRQAYCHAIEGDRALMEAALAEATTTASGDDEVTAGIWGQARATLSLLAEDRSRGLEELDIGVSLLRDKPGALPWTFRGVSMLLRTTEDVDGEAAREAVRASTLTAMPFHGALLGYADAVSLGASGDHRGAAEHFAVAEARISVLAGRGGFGHYALRLVAERALQDGWGEPVAWLREAVVFFEDKGHDRVASACRSLLRQAGAPLPRRQRSDLQVPPRLRALGITARELDVLELISQRLSNKEIGLRLYISPRTVDKHVQHLLVKTGLQERSGLRVLATDESSSVTGGG